MIGSNQAAKIGIVAISLLGALWLTSAILTSGGNVIANSYRYFAVAALLIGLFAPKYSLYVLMVLAVYLGLIKKVMILDGRFAFTELYYVVGTPAYLLFGACVSTLLGLVMRGKMNRKNFLLMVIFAGFSAIVIFGMYFTGQGLPLAILAGSFVNVVWVMAIHFDSEKEIKRLILVGTFAMIPAAFYGIWQGEVGLTQLDYMYAVESGYAEDEGDEILIGKEPRPFATFGSNAQYGFAMILLIVFLLQYFFRARSHAGKLVVVMAMIVAIWALYHSTNKSSYLSLPCLVAAAIVIRSRVAFVAAVAGTFLLIAFLAFNAKIVSDLFREWSVVTGAIHQGLTLNTINTRLESFEGLLDPEIYQILPRNLKEARQEGAHTHTMLTDMVIGLGAPLTLLLIGGGIGGFLFVQKRFIIPVLKSHYRRPALLALCYALTIFMAGFMGASAYKAFPTSYFLWVQIGIAVWYIMNFSLGALGVKQKDQEGAVDLPGPGRGQRVGLPLPRRA